jgi:hypothetical protein
MSDKMGAVQPSTRYSVECYDPAGNLKWSDVADNLVVNAGLNDLLDKYFKGSSYTAAHYIGLTSGTPTIAAGDTLASHAGWTEVTAYTGDRKAFTPGSVSSQSVSNSNDRAEFTVSTNNTTIGGLFLATVASGTSGTLYGVAAFAAGNKTLDEEDILRVTATATAAAA